MKYRILDLDNCIADDSWRIPLIDGTKKGHERFSEYHHRALDDVAANHELFRCPYKIVIFTSRPNYFRARTNWWLKRNGIEAVALFMRDAPDHRGSVEVKEEMLDRFLHMGHRLGDIESAYDDRQNVVDMFLRAGVPAQRRWVHEVPYPEFVV